jgi:hypothetical protein
MLEKIEQEMNQIEVVRAQLFEVKKIQLHPNIEGFESPDIYGTYKSTGGQPLGVVGRVFEPLNQHLLLDSVVSSITECSTHVDASKLEFREMRGGARVHFEIPFTPREIKSPMVGDVVKSKLIVRTGYDGLTKTSVSYHVKRLWCSNGAASWQKEVEIGYKNTIGNQVKAMLFCNEILKVEQQLETYLEGLSRISGVKYTQKQLDEFLTKLTGYSVKDYAELTTRKRNILDRINASIAIEAQNTGWNAFSILQGVTRYTTHELCAGDPEHEDIYFANAGIMNTKAHALLLN